MPNIRDLFLPDRGMILVECDLKQADAQIVAWESDDPTLKALFRKGSDIYTEIETGVWSDPHLPLQRQIRKNCVHSVNYGAGYRTLAERYIHSESSAKHFIANWFHHHPAVREWHRRVEWEMRQSRTPTIHNIFGYRRVYATSTPITQPLAWIGQSTVARINKQMILNLSELEPLVQLLLPHHDSVLMQLPTNQFEELIGEIYKRCLIPIPYSDPLTIPVEIKASPISWGRLEPVTLPPASSGLPAVRLAG